jgi:hypothetical protein
MGAGEIKFGGEPVGREREYIEICATLRHYSNLRFLIMPFYFAVNGAMFAGFQYENIRKIPNLWIIIVLLSCLTAWVFGVIEYKINKYIEGYIKCAEKVVPGCHWSSRKGGVVVLISFLMTYAVVAGCWWFFAWNVYRP